MLDFHVSTPTLIEQQGLEKKLLPLLERLSTEWDDDQDAFILDRKRHAKYIHGGLGSLPAGFSSLDASRTWICFWNLHSLALLQQPLPSSPDRQSIISFLRSCQHPDGGFGGGPFQLPHLATTYAAVAALVTLGGPEALEWIERDKLFNYLLSMCVPLEKGGGMPMHEGGEVDIRGCYCALAACHMLCLDKRKLAEACSLAHYVSSCQSHEGGLGGEPSNEAHGGYAFCGYTALALADLTDAIDQQRLLSWAARMQGFIEGGFMGRTCKLVDGCYSLWQGGIFPILDSNLRNSLENKETSSNKDEDYKNIPAADVDHLAEELQLGSDSLAFINALQPKTQPEVAKQHLNKLTKDIQVTLEETLAAAELAKKQQDVPSEVKRTSTAALQRLAHLQQALEGAKQHMACCNVSAFDIAEKARQVDGNILGSNESNNGSTALYNAVALQVWLLGLCQGIRGGLRDKPGKPVDYYHTCYCLSGLSSAQHTSGIVLGGKRNLLTRADPLCNVVQDKVDAARAFFTSR